MEPNYSLYMHNELTEHVIYSQLAAREKNPDNKAILSKLAAEEKGHYEFWRTVSGSAEIQPRRWVVYSYALLRTFLGVTFTTKFLEGHENAAVRNYEAIIDIIPIEYIEQLHQIIADEKSHERSLLAQIKEKRIAYLSFIVLGLADAIVEITGVHAGFLGVTGSTMIAGISGIIVGFAAAISMGSAAYLQAKQDPDKSPLASAFTTGLSYLFSVVCLALPYFLLRSMYPAFVVSASVGIILIGAFTFYGAIVFDRKFWHDFLEAVILMLGTAVATYALGKAVSAIFHVGGQNF
jgi:VIT1/CCC1 family predicted Fe2+/Mn2+ transporter